MEKYSPIVLFTYNRPWHTRQTLDALSRNEEAQESILYIYCEGAKNNALPENIKKIEEVRRIVKSETRFKKVVIVEQGENLGLANSVLSGVTDVINIHERVIVLEDDHITSPYFLRYMNDGLQLYENVEEVACLSGYIYPVKGKLPETFFIKGADCWGWATWKRIWTDFERDGKKLLDALESSHQTFAFDFDGTYPYTQMLKGQIEGKNSSWAIRWYASAFLKNKYCLYPGISLVQNIGIDGSGTHSGISDKWKITLSDHPVTVRAIDIEENREAKILMIEYFKNLSSSSSFLKRVVGKIKSVFKN